MLAFVAFVASWSPRLSVHRELLKNPNLVMFCTSQHLCNFVERFSEGGLNTTARHIHAEVMPQPCCRR